jgi:crispr-associated ramp protein
MDISYKIKFYSEWHCGSGLASGAALDALVVKDKDRLPYVPGKTIKGLVREAVENILFWREEIVAKRALFVETFGNAEDKAWDITDDSEVNKMSTGKAFFGNAELSDNIKAVIKKNDLENYLYRNITSTAIEEGVAKPNSLRQIETVVPCELEGKIWSVPDDFVEQIKDGLKYIKRLGTNRNRGLGRCDVIIEKGV